MHQLFRHTRTGTKHHTYALYIALAIFVLSVSSLHAQTPTPVGLPDPIPLVSKAAVVIDAASGRVLFEHNAHKPLPPASVTKVMTMLLALEAVQDEKVTLDDMITTSSRASSMGGTQIWLEVGERMSLGDMLWAIAVGSANDAAVAVAEFLAGSEQRFAEIMNERARQLGAQNTHFLNASGLPPADVGYEGQHVTSAYDLALMSRHAITLPHFIEMVSTWGPVVMRPDGSQVPELYSFNKLLRSYPGLDGIKTGYTSEAGYSLSASAVRDNIRIIAVTLGAPSGASRDDDVRRLLDYGFSRLRPVTLYEAGDTVDVRNVQWGHAEFVTTVVKEDITVAVLDDDEEPEYMIEWYEDALVAPVESGHIVGELIVTVGGYEVARAPIATKESVPRASWTHIILRNARRLLGKQFGE